MIRGIDFPGSIEIRWRKKGKRKKKKKKKKEKKKVRSRQEVVEVTTRKRLHNGGGTGDRGNARRCGWLTGECTGKISAEILLV